MSEREQDLDAMNRAHGEHILDAVADQGKRQEQDRALLDAITRASLAQQQEDEQE